ncbi:endonuclease VII domain-containing protein [Streptomyces sp. NBC_00481]|uniref:endonuclease domain-containing protein n=1 Tax=Streptomyces sp. NBC_00481 TaxID=2975755 RepID=UPI002DDA1C92|nr:endonuclease domain-containing protein [Streptomyces sp. NBC_00481]WRZ01178.1 endonuclease VII domain-containing protein [Streptomyces sp. NBC_00481]
MSPISPQYANQLLAELTEGCPVPAAPASLSRYTFQMSNHILIGDTAVRGHKYKGRWRLDDRDIRKAGERLAALPFDPDDLVDARLTSAERDRTWRTQIRRWFEHFSYRDQNTDICPCEGQQPRSQALPAHHGPGCGATFEQVKERYGRWPIACTSPLPQMTWSGTAWTMPRAYVALLDRADRIAAECVEQAARCSRCDATGDVWKWRTSSNSGYTTLCPACTVSVARPYKDHLRGRLYASLLKNSQPEAFLCRLCSSPRQAVYWDHCHTHGFVRGPVCASCNTYEGGGYRFIHRPGAVSHLLRCDGCRRDRTVPPRHHPDIMLQTFTLDPHRPCAKRPHSAWGSVQEDGSVRFRMRCWGCASSAQWEQVVPAVQVRQLVREFVDKALAAEADEPGQDSA